jgi:hypothetical protein
MASKPTSLTESFVPAFSRAPVRAELRLMILSTCLNCGESQAVSSTDGSLEEWENHHRCRDVAPVTLAS